MENKQELINERNQAESHVKEYYAVYKCPLCSTKFRITDKTFQMDKDKFPELIAKIIKNQTMLGNPYLYQAPMHIPHECNNGGVGIAQLIGFSPIVIK